MKRTQETELKHTQCSSQITPDTGIGFLSPSVVSNKTTFSSGSSSSSSHKKKKPKRETRNVSSAHNVSSMTPLLLEKRLEKCVKRVPAPPSVCDPLRLGIHETI